jgi:predicted MFS family arabinose efflux permease
LSAENVNNPFLFSGIIMLMTAATAWYVMNNSKPTKKHKINFIKYTKIVIKDSLNTSKGNIKIKLLFLRGVLFAFAVQSINSYYQIFFKNMGLNNMILGWIYVLISLSMIIGQKITEKKVTPVNRFKFLLSFDLLTVIFILISATVIEVNISIVFFLLHEVCRGGNEPIVSDLYNAEIHDQSRATLISFRSMIGTIGATIGAFVYSFISKHLIISRMWWISGLLLFVVFLITYKLAKAYYTSLKETIEKGQNIEV